MMKCDVKMPVKAYQIYVDGYGFGANPIYARSRGKALADTWRGEPFGHLTFKQFLQKSKATVCDAHPRFGERITVNGDEGYIVYLDRQYIHFVKPDNSTIYCTHPLDVEPPEARRGTAYYK